MKASASRAKASVFIGVIFWFCPKVTQQYKIVKKEMSFFMMMLNYIKPFEFKVTVIKFLTNLW
jgi:hypothetical protein